MSWHDFHITNWYYWKKKVTFEFLIYRYLFYNHVTVKAHKYLVETFVNNPKSTKWIWLKLHIWFCSFWISFLAGHDQFLNIHWSIIFMQIKIFKMFSIRLYTLSYVTERNRMFLRCIHGFLWRWYFQYWWNLCTSVDKYILSKL